LGLKHGNPSLGDKGHREVETITLKQLILNSREDMGPLGRLINENLRGIVAIRIVMSMNEAMLERFSKLRLKIIGHGEGSFCWLITYYYTKVELE